MHFYLCFLLLNMKTAKVRSKYNLSCCLGVTEEFLQLLCAPISASCCFPAGPSSKRLPLLQVGSSMRFRASHSTCASFLAAASAHLQELETSQCTVRHKHLNAAQCSCLVFILKVPTLLPCKPGAFPCHSKVQCSQH